MSETMVEKVARALCAARGAEMPDAEWQASVRHYRDMSSQYPDYANGHSLMTDAFRDARAAIEAMREPTPEMLQGMWTAMFTEPFDGTSLPMLGAGWTAAIDAALSDA